MFVDASAWTAILLNEPEAEDFERKLLAAEQVLTSAVANWETARAIGKTSAQSPALIQARMASYQLGVGARVVGIGEAEQAVALDAHARFGKGVHAAKLNMGDCFAYACARTNGAPLLYKGDDFALTDIDPA